MRCGWLRCHVDRFEVVVWGELEDDLVIRTTQIYSVLQSTTPVLLRTTKYYSSSTPYYTVLLQYYSVLQSITRARGGGGSFETTKTIGEIGCCESRMSEQKH